MKNIISLSIMFGLLSGCVDESGHQSGYNRTSSDNYPAAQRTGMPSSDHGEFKLEFEPLGIPIKFSLGKNGISASFSKSVVTPIGRFSLKYTRKVYKNTVRPHYAKISNSNQILRKKDLYDTYKFDKVTVETREDIQNLLITSDATIVAIIRSEEHVDVFMIEEGVELELVSEGLSRTRVKKSYVEIDVRHSKVRELNLYKHEDEFVKTYAIPVDRFESEYLIHEDIFADTSSILDVEINSLDDVRSRTRTLNEAILINNSLNSDTLVKKKYRAPF